MTDIIEEARMLVVTRRRDQGGASIVLSREHEGGKAKHRGKEISPICEKASTVEALLTHTPPSRLWAMGYEGVWAFRIF